MILKSLLLACVLWGPVLAQVPDLGAPFIKNYETESFKASPQNWISMQDRRGVMYFGNTLGILELDGQRWRRISPSKGADSVVRAMTLGSDGTIYYGSIDDFGFLAASPTGLVSAVSLKDAIPEAERSFGDIWQVESCPEGVYFFASKKIFRFHGGKITVLPCRFPESQACVLNGALFFEDAGRGVCLLEGDQAIPIPALAGLSDGQRLCMVPFGRHGLLVSRASGGFCRVDLAPLWDEASGHYLPSRPVSTTLIQTFPTELDPLTRATPGFVQVLAPLRREAFAVSTVSAGVITFDHSGKIIRAINKAAGLPDNTVTHVMEDRAGNLWATGISGISHIEMSPAQSWFGASHGLEGVPLSVCFYEGRLHVGTYQGAFVQEPHRYSLKQDHPAFVAVRDAPREIWQLLEVGGELLAASGDGLHRIRGARAFKIAGSRNNAICMSPSRRWPGHLFVGFADGLDVFRSTGGQWSRVGRVEGTEGNIIGIAEDAGGDLWLSTYGQGLRRLHGSGDQPTQWTVRRMGLEQGLPSLDALQAVVWGSTLYVATPNGLYRADVQPWSSEGPDSTRFVPDLALGKPFHDPPAAIDHLVPDGKGGFLFVSYEGVTWVAPGEGGAFRVVARPFQGLPSTVITAYVHPHGSIWLPGKSLYRIDPSAPKDYGQRFNVLIRKVMANNARGLFEGSHASENQALWSNRTVFQGTQRAVETPELPYRENDVTFEFSATFFEKPGTTQFQYLLEGFDKGWSAWSSGTFKEYTNLPEGPYRFRVRAKNLYGQQGEEAAYAFRINPPWFRTAWAILLWILCGGASVAGVIQLYTRKLRQQKARLEQLVAERTQQLQDATLTDPLTGLRNRRFISEVLLNDVEAFVDFKIHVLKSRSTRQHRSESEIMGLFLLDLDHFKQVNDTYGHEAGDRVLKQVAQVLKDLVRKDDVVIRLGGEEFLVVLKKVKADFLYAFARKMLKKVAETPFELGDGTLLQKTCSIGYLSFPLYAEHPRLLTFEQSLQVADLGLYYAKGHGRNRVVQVVEGSRMPLEGEALNRALSSLDVARAEGYLNIE